MAKTKLTLSVEQAVVEQAKRFSKRNDTTVSELVTHFLASLEEADGESAPITARLVGALSPQGSREEYHEYLEQKYR
jgi:hypothetical protein